MSKIEKYSDLWILHLASSVGEISINPLKYRKPKWHKRLFNLAKKGWLKKERTSCSSYYFSLTKEGKQFIRDSV